MASDLEVGIIFIVIILTVIGAVILVAINDAKEKRETEIWKTQNRKSWEELRNNLTHIISRIGQLSPVCNKCGNSELQVWTVDGNYIKTRCGNYNCKKISKEWRIDFMEDATFSEFIDNYLSFMRTASEINGKISNYVYSTNPYDWSFLRGDQPVYRAFITEANPNFIRPTIKKIRKRRSRTIPTEVKKEVWRRDEGCCITCGSNEDIHFDHILPWSKGGSNTIENIQLLCKVCNLEKSAKII